MCVYVCVRNNYFQKILEILHTLRKTMRIQWTDLKVFTSIGSGSFGRVYHGDLLGTEVAIKECVRSESRAFDEKYFKREVDILK